MGRAMFYRVRKINDNYYLIKEYYDPQTGKKRTVSLGNCEKIEQLVRGVGFEPTQAYATGSSTRPHRAIPRTRRKVFPRFIAIHGRNEAEKFMKLCIQNASYETCKQYLTYLIRPVNIQNKWSVLAYKKYAKLFNKKELYESLKTIQSKPDLKVPSLEEIKQTLIKACNTSKSLCLVYKILLESGARLKHVTLMLSSFNDKMLKEHDGFYTYTMNIVSGKKKQFYIFSITKPYYMSITDKWVRNWASKRRVVNPKYVRKFVATQMSSLGIPIEIIDFIQGRAPERIITKHYMNLFGLSLNYYKKYADWLRTVLYDKLCK